MSEIPKSVFFVQDQQVGIAQPKKVPKKADTSIHEVADVALQKNQETFTLADFSKIKVVFDKKYTTLISEKKSPRLLLKLTRGVNWLYGNTIGAIINKVYKNIHREVYSKLAQVVNIETRKTQLEDIKKALGSTEGEQAFSKKIDSLIEQLNQGTISPQNFDNARKNVKKGVTLIEHQKEFQTCGGQCGKDLSTQITDVLKELDLNNPSNSFLKTNPKYEQLSELLKIKNTLSEKSKRVESEEKLLTKISEVLDSGKLESLQSLIDIHTQINELNKLSKPYPREIDLLKRIGNLLEQKEVENLSNDIKKINSMITVIKELKTIKTTIEKSSNKFNCQNALVKEIEAFLKNSNSDDLPNNLKLIREKNEKINTVIGFRNTLDRLFDKQKARWGQIPELTQFIVLQVKLKELLNSDRFNELNSSRLDFIADRIQIISELNQRNAPGAGLVHCQNDLFHRLTGFLQNEQPELVQPTETVNRTEISPVKLKKNDSKIKWEMDSHKLSSLGEITEPDSTIRQQNAREYFLNEKKLTGEVLLSKSEFVGSSQVRHLMEDKQDTAIGVKYKPGDKITNMEGALHTFLTPITPIQMVGDYTFDTSKHQHTVNFFTNSDVRNVILSAAIHPDFENDEVMLQVVSAHLEPKNGKECSKSELQPLDEDGLKNKEVRDQHDTLLRNHMIYHLASDHKLPGVEDIIKGKEGCRFYTGSKGIERIEKLISGDEPISGELLKNEFVVMNGHFISLEALYNVYVQQVRNEMSALEQALPQGYIYTINPPSIFARELGPKGAELMNRLQILAFKQFNDTQSFVNLKGIGFDDFQDKKGLKLYQQVFKESNIKVMSRTDYYKGVKGAYSGPNGAALVIHNNSDGFGQNIEKEHAFGSLDAAVGCNSNAALQLKRDREDLCSHVI